MKATDLLKENKPTNILFYGRPGTSKTALVSQAAGGWLADFDDGMLTAATMNDKFSPLRNAIEFDRFIDAKPAAPEAYMRFKSELMKIVNQVAAGNWKYDCIIIDSLTGLCKAVRLYVMSLSGGAFKIPQIQHWGQMVNEVETVLTMCRALNVLVLLTAHEMAEESGDRISIHSMTKNHGVNGIPWLFNEVLYTRVKPAGAGKFNYIVSNMPSDKYVTRTRSSIVGDVVHNDVGLYGVLKKVGYDYPKAKIG